MGQENTGRANPGPGKDKPTNRSSGEASSPLSGNRTAHRDPNQSLFRRHPVLTTLAVLAIIFIVIPVIIVGIMYQRQDIPTPESMSTNQISEIYAQDDSTLMGRIVPPEGNRNIIKIDDVPVHVRNAVLAAEDRTFYSNQGFDPIGIARAALGQVTGESSAGGGSTITQQYVKNTMVGDEVSYERKAKEILTSAKMTSKWSKDQILEGYLNTIYFGRGAYGIDAAAQAYFNKPVSALTVSEGALLAGTIQSPSALDPFANRPAAEQRWNYVLDGMVDMGALPADERKGAQFPAIVEDAAPLQQNVGHESNGPIRRQVLAELANSGISEDMVNTRGLRVITTIDPEVQNNVIDSVEEVMSYQPEANRAAAVSMDPKSGAVRGYYGGNEAEGWDYANAPLQTGSTFKIFALAAALDQGIPLSQQISSAPVTSGNITITNSGGMSCGTCSVATALEKSLNTSFIRLQTMLENGPQDTADMAHKAGIAKKIPGLPDETLTEGGEPPFEGVVLGQYPVRVLDMATGLSTFANEGMYHKPHFVKKVIAADGEVLLDNSEMEGEQRVNKDVANNLISAMEPIAGASRNHALAGGRASAAKSGTAQLLDTGNNKDAWFIGATPSLSTAVWMGTDENVPLYSGGSGGSMFGAMDPADIWKSIMDSSLAGTEYESFPDPGYIGGQAGAPGDSGSSSGTGQGTGGGQSYTGGQDYGYTDSQPSQQAPAQGGQQAPTGGGTGGGGGGGAPAQDPAQNFQDQVNDFLDGLGVEGGEGGGGGGEAPAEPAPPGGG